MMITQRLLLKLLRAGLLPRPLRALLEGRPWRIEAGAAAGLRICLPQNLDFVRGTTEPPMQDCVVRHLEPGGVFYDIGANVGFFSILATRRVGPSGIVYAFEPVAENVSAIRANARLNGFGNLTALEVAVDAGAGSRDLYLTAWDGGASLVRAAIPAGESVLQRAVATASLDVLIERHGLRPPSLVKIDVEGAEMAVLRGMTKAIRQFRPVLAYEVDDANAAALASRWKDLDDYVTSLGYRITRLENSYSNTTWFVGHSIARPIAGARV